MAIEDSLSSQRRNIAARRFNIPKAPAIATFTIPERVTQVICKNEGLVPVRFNFGNDSNGDYWELAPGETMPVAIKVNQGVGVKATAMGDTSIMQCIFWG